MAIRRFDDIFHEHALVSCSFGFRVFFISKRRSRQWRCADVSRCANQLIADGPSIFNGILDLMSNAFDIQDRFADRSSRLVRIAKREPEAIKLVRGQLKGCTDAAFSSHLRTSLHRLRCSWLAKLREARQNLKIQTGSPIEEAKKLHPITGILDLETLFSQPHVDVCQATEYSDRWGANCPARLKVMRDYVRSARGTSPFIEDQLI